MLFVFLSLCISVCACSGIDTKAIDRMVELTIPVDGPGGALIICKDNRIIYRKAFGYADIDAKVPNIHETVFQVGSIYKMMTAAGIPEWNPRWGSSRSLEDTINLVKKKEFDFQPGGKFMYNNSGYAMLAFIREDQLKIYEGIYKFRNNMDAKIYIENGKLKAFLRGQPVYTLSPIGDNKFMLVGLAGFTLIFEADSSGKITELISSQPNGDFKAKRIAE